MKATDLLAAVNDINTHMSGSSQALVNHLQAANRAARESMDRELSDAKQTLAFWTEAKTDAMSVIENKFDTLISAQEEKITKLIAKLEEYDVKPKLDTRIST